MSQACEQMQQVGAAEVHYMQVRQVVAWPGVVRVRARGPPARWV